MGIHEKRGDLEVQDIEENVRREAAILVDKVLDESVQIVNVQYEHDNKEEADSESENYAITCDDVAGLDVIKSPTIESISGKSFDDNISLSDELNSAAPISRVTSAPATNLVWPILEQPQNDSKDHKSEESSWHSDGLSGAGGGTFGAETTTAKEDRK